MVVFMSPSGPEMPKPGHRPGNEFVFCFGAVEPRAQNVGNHKWVRILFLVDLYIVLGSPWLYQVLILTQMTIGKWRSY